MTWSKVKTITQGEKNNDKQSAKINVKQIQHCNFVLYCIFFFFFFFFFSEKKRRKVEILLTFSSNKIKLNFVAFLQTFDKCMPVISRHFLESQLSR